MQRARPVRGEGRGRSPPPVLLAERAGAPQEQAGQIVALEQGEERGEGRAIQPRHHAGEDDDERREAAAAGQQEDGADRDQPASQRHPFASEGEEARRPDQGGGEGEIGARLDAEGGRRGDGIAEHLLEDSAGEPERRTRQQAHHETRREAVGGEHIGRAAMVRGDDRRPPSASRQQRRDVRPGAGKPDGAKRENEQCRPEAGRGRQAGARECRLSHCPGLRGDGAPVAGRSAWPRAACRTSAPAAAG